MTHREISAKGGRAGRGPSKARTSEQARAAALARWRHGDGAVGRLGGQHDDGVGDVVGDKNDAPASKSIEQAIVDEKDDRTELPEDAEPIADAMAERTMTAADYAKADVEAGVKF